MMAFCKYIYLHLCCCVNMDVFSDDHDDGDD